MSVVLWVVLLVVSTLALVGLGLAVFLRWLRRRKRVLTAALVADVRTTGERLTRGPEDALYRGATAGYSQVGGNGVLLLTPQRLLFCKLTGGRIEVRLSEVTGVREARTFRGFTSLGRRHVIVQLRTGAEVGFLVADSAGWLAALRATLAGSDPA